MGFSKNYKVLYGFSAGLYGAAVLVHATGYFTNILYVLAWLLWMPAIALAVICGFDIKNSSNMERREIFSGKHIRNIMFVLMAISAVYVVFNLVYGFSILNAVSDIRTEGGVYYALDANNKETEIGYNEYVRYSLAGFRLLSGHMLVFIAAPMWYYGEKKKMHKM